MAIRLLAALAAAGIALAALHVAGAAPPVNDKYTYTEGGSIDCGTFVDNFVDYYTISDTTYFGRNGEAVKDVVHVGHISDDVNSVSGLTLHEHDHFVIIFDFVRGKTYLNGAEFVMNRKGEGIVLHDTGRLVFGENGIEFQAGPHQVNNDGEDLAFCRALG